MKDRVAGLDALRTLGAMMILIFHLALIFYLSVTHSPKLTPIVDNFFMGVQLFFLISAFSLYYQYFNRLNNRIEIKAFVIRRYLRIAPLFYIMFAVFVVFGYMTVPTPVIPVPISFEDYFLHFTLLFNLFPQANDSLVIAGWSISVLFLFYLMLPVLIIFIRKARYALILLVGSLFLSSWYYFQMLALVPSIPNYFPERSIVTQFPFFIMGIFCFLILRGHLGRDTGNPEGSNNPRSIGNVFKKRLLGWCDRIRIKRVAKITKRISELLIKRILNIVGLGLIIFGTLLICMLILKFGLYSSLVPITSINAKYYAWGLGFGCLIFGVALYPAKFFVNRFTKFIAERSYSIYLLHGFVIALLYYLDVYDRIYEWVIDSDLTFLISLLLTFILVMAIATVSYRYLELPIARYSNKRKSLNGIQKK